MSSLTWVTSLQAADLQGQTEMGEELGTRPEVSQLYYQVHLISLHMGAVQSGLYSVAEGEDFDCDLAAKPGTAVLRDRHENFSNERP